ncbi:MAG: hypothetical protein RI929_296 [Actinomycetota bacterium]|jgi:glucosamine-phosphate N-acetyltransferase
MSLNQSPFFPWGPGARVVDLERKHLHEVVELLQGISEFRPSLEDLDAAWNTRQANPFLKSFVVEDSTGNAIAFGALLLEQKLRGGVLGHVEDIVVRDDMRGLGVGAKLVQHIMAVGRYHGCYKLVLSCSPDNEAFYRGLGFSGNARSLQLLIE